MRRRIEWQIKYPDVDVALWVDVRKLNAAWQIDEDYVGAPPNGPDNQPAKYPRVGQWFQKQTFCWMPIVNLAFEGVAFTDGRHRFAWLRDHGVKAVPIATDPSELAEMRRRFGTRLRVSWLST